MSKLFFSATAGGADAFVQASIQTGLSGQTKQGFRVIEIAFEFVAVPGPFLAVAANQDVEVAITRRTKAAMPAISDIDVIKKWAFGMTAGSTVGQFLEPDMVQTWRPPSPDARKLSDGMIAIVEDPVYVQIDSTATTQVQAIVGYIEYEIITMSEVDRLTLLTASLV